MSLAVLVLIVAIVWSERMHRALDGAMEGVARRVLTAWRWLTGSVPFHGPLNVARIAGLLICPWLVWGIVTDGASGPWVKGAVAAISGVVVGAASFVLWYTITAVKSEGPAVGGGVLSRGRRLLLFWRCWLTLVVLPTTLRPIEWLLFVGMLGVWVVGFDPPSTETLPDKARRWAASLNPTPRAVPA